MNKEFNRLLKAVEYQNRIEQLKRDIMFYNSQSEYFRLKYYDNMIHSLRLLKQYLNEVRK
jgi:hypothetical protein